MNNPDLTHCCLHRCPRLKTLAMNCNGRDNWGAQFAQLPMSSTLTNVQLKIQGGIPDLHEVLNFWKGLGAARGLITLKIVFSAFQEERIHWVVRALPPSTI